ncbi:putative 4-hydroxy-2-oxoglutarate aldolase, mitochondrial [Cyphellophora attinorum]|uniref:Putative 4-hydroxy-2-oxoglutarate aldolase, mitochondrial n=1 Tax=Cyphellophora attinorum TaxID=1664694 RepID=A0A0N1HE47_9EURO|nr:putative 4-hydroxy-2-oxoglutarate aldolase, mitochondrial [Phialophora attinorum]KPI43563.1 putative 4-hydroxy-2-oxoglutarate aldolase, mitochondrial [Phialophora attinorum]
MRPLPPGIYTPLPTFFDDQEELDLASFRKHVAFIAEAGTVPVIAGSMGEACHLEAWERDVLVRSAREVLDQNPATSDVPIVVGVGSPSTRETVKLAIGAAAAGADFVMVIPPGYYGSVLRQDNMLAVKRYMVDVSNASPSPVIVYNFPALAGGIDITSELVVEMVKDGPNICGIKLTCADVAKLSRIDAVMRDADFQQDYPRRFHGTAEGREAIPYFSAIDGFIDILLPSVSVGAVGAISGLPNIAPRVCVKLWNLCEESKMSSGKREEARRLQDVINAADYVVKPVGVSGMKYLLSKQFGYGASPRRPLLPYDVPSAQRAERLLKDPGLAKVLELERRLCSSIEDAKL